MIGTYQKKPTRVQAVKYDGTMASADEILIWIESKGERAWPVQFSNKLKLWGNTGEMLISKDDWVILGVDGTFYPCPDDVFQLNHEEVTE